MPKLAWVEAWVGFQLFSVSAFVISCPLNTQKDAKPDTDCTGVHGNEMPSVKISEICVSFSVF